MRRVLTRGDKVLIMAVLLLALAGIAGALRGLPAAERVPAQVLVAGPAVRTVPLAGRREEFRVTGPGGGYDVVQVDGTRVRVREADCPDKLCVKMGWISRPPQQIVCVPNHVVVRVIGGKPDDVDAIIR